MLTSTSHTVPPTSDFALDELRKETQMGSEGTIVQREIRRIDLSNFEQRKQEITEQLWSAATEIGFFQIYNHGISTEDINKAFALSESFFALPHSTKAQWPLSRNAGWESMSQIRPSTRTADQKESYQITRPRMAGLWPAEEDLPGFKASALAFEAQCWQVGMRVLSCFADKLGFATDFFTHAHDPQKPSYQSTLRMLHYFAQDANTAPGTWRAGAHTDYDCLTLLFQRPGQGGLQVLPGKEMEGRAWTPVEPAEGVITCNIGDMLMRWSDDQLPSNFHRVKNPAPHEYQGARYSLAFFCQANEEVVIQSRSGKYPDITAAEYLKQRISANFSNRY